MGKRLYFAMVVAVTMTKWTASVYDLVLQEQDFNSEWNPYSVLHIEDDGSFRTKEIRESYKKLSLKYHPDKVNWDKVKGQEVKVKRRWENLVLAHKTLT